MEQVRLEQSRDSFFTAASLSLSSRLGARGVRGRARGGGDLGLGGVVW